MGIGTLAAILFASFLFLAGMVTGWAIGGGAERYAASIKNKRFLANKSEEQIARAHVELSMTSTLSVIGTMRHKLTDEEQEYITGAEHGIGKLLAYYAINKMSILNDAGR